MTYANELEREELRVKGTTSPKDLAGSVVKNLAEGHTVVLSCIGHQAIGQAVKSLPIANSMIAAQGFLITALVSFEVKHMILDGKPAERTAAMLQLVRIRPGV